MKLLLWILLLCILLFFSLGNTIPLIHIPYASAPPKYKSPPDYYSDTMAIQGVFAKTIEPMENAPKLNLGSKLTGQNLNIRPSGSSNFGDRMRLLQSNKDTDANYGDRMRMLQPNKDTDFGDKIRAFQENKDTDANVSPTRKEYRSQGRRPFQEQRAEQSEPEPSTRRTFNPSTATTESSTYPTGQRVSEWKEEINCANTPYGCCSDGVTIKTSDGCPAPADSTCMGSQYGCCPDGVTLKNANGSSCAAYPPSGPTIYILPIQTSPDTAAPIQSAPVQAAPVETSQSLLTQPTQPTQPTQTAQATQPVQPVPTQQPILSSPVLPNDPYTSYQTSQPQSLNGAENTVFLSPPHGKATVPTCPKPQPCPPCGRCPEPSFECKKVPNYSSTSNVLPVPVLTDFSQFGM